MQTEEKKTSQFNVNQFNQETKNKLDSSYSDYVGFSLKKVGKCFVARFFFYVRDIIIIICYAFSAKSIRITCSVNV